MAASPGPARLLENIVVEAECSIPLRLIRELPLSYGLCWLYVSPPVKRRF